MSEYIYTDLPRYVKTTPRENFSNSVVKSGSVLLFSEDGENLVAKLPDGTFKEIGGSGEYYKCASVDTSAKTWTGYKAVLNDGVYTFESNVTTGLAYTSMTPVVGNIYSADALVTVSSLYEGAVLDGLVFYAPLDGLSQTAETGQSLTFTNISYEYDSELGKNVCKFLSKSKILSSEDENFAVGKTGTISLNFKASSTSGGQCLACVGNTEAYAVNLYLRENGVAVGNIGRQVIRGEFAANTWHSLISAFSENSIKLYLDGNLLFSGSSFENGSGYSNSINVTGTFISIGYVVNSFEISEEHYTGLISSVRLYNRELNESEINYLSFELLG